jgi:type I restriction modification DNA specificity protein
MLELKNIASTLSGVTVHEAYGGTARFVRLSDLSDLKAGRKPVLAAGEAPTVARALPIEDGDLIIGARGAATDVCLATAGMLGAFVSLDLYLVRPDVSKVDPGYLAAVLELPATQVLFAGGKQGSGLARLPKDALENVPIPLPPLPQQRLIAELAESFNDEDRLLKRLADLNSILGREAIARAIRAVNQRQNS